jgi:adenylate cyclase
VARLDPAARHARLIELVRALVRDGVRTPTIIIIEDVHWLDEASAGLLAHLASGVGDLPWLVLVTRRDVDTGFVATEGPHVERLRPAPLTAAAAAKLANAATSDAPLPPHVLRAVTERSGGNPLLLAS